MIVWTNVAEGVGMSRKADYMYRDVRDRIRIRVYKRDSGRWDYDIFRRDDNTVQNNASISAVDYDTKHEAKMSAVQMFGTLISIQPENCTDGWSSEDMAQASRMGGAINARAKGGR